jgi:hypothetical protein
MKAKQAEQSAGRNQVVWNADVSSRLYFYQLDAVSESNPNRRFVDVKEMILLKCYFSSTRRDSILALSTKTPEKDVRGLLF